MIGTEDLERQGDVWELNLLLPDFDCAHGWQPGYPGVAPADCHCWEEK